MIKTLNLANKAKSDIDYKINRYPDGQQSIAFTVPEGYSKEKPLRIKIISRMRDFRALELISSAVSVIRNQNSGVPIDLCVPYLLGARSDRRLTPNGDDYLADVVAPVINGLQFDRVQTLDVHSTRANWVIHRLFNYGAYELHGSIPQYVDTKNTIVIAPDKGAVGRAKSAAFQWGAKVLTFKKERTENGIVVKPDQTEEVVLNDNFNGRFIIVDDICDGGRTFIEIAKALNEAGFEKNLKHLVVTHGLFSNGFEELFKYFASIHTTNSCGDIEDPFYRQMLVYQIDVML